jgi:hypothetical protein
VEDGGVRDVTDEYKIHLERELHATAVELAALLEGSLLKSVMSPEPQIFYRKLCGDFYRYLAEVSVPGAAGQWAATGKADAGQWLADGCLWRDEQGQGDAATKHCCANYSSCGQGHCEAVLCDSSAAAERSTRALGCRSVHYAVPLSPSLLFYLLFAAVLPYANPVAAPAAPPAAGVSASSVVPLGYEKKSLEAYQVAMRLASTHLEATHPTRLGLCLNYSVLLYEVLKDRKAACELARSAFDHAIAKLDDLDESSYKDTTLLMQVGRGLREGRGRLASEGTQWMALRFAEQNRAERFRS